MRQSQAATSLVEVLVAGAIVALAIVPIISVLTGAGDNLRQTMPYFQAVFLMEKGLEEARLGGQEDAHFERILADAAFDGNRTTVAFGAHRFLNVLEDSKPPYGRIEPGRDLSIRPEAGILYKLAEPLGVTVNTLLASSPSGNGEELRSSIGFDWQDARGRGRGYTLATLLKSWVELERVESRTAMDDVALGKAVDPAATSLTALAAQRGADPTLFRAFATVLAVGESSRLQIEAEAAPLAALAASRDSAPTQLERNLAGQALSRRSESLATSLLGALQQLREPVVTLASGLPPGSLGNPAPPLEQRRRCVDLVSLVLRGFFGSLRGSLTAALDLGGSSRILTGARVAAHLRTVRVAQMEALTAPWPDQGLLVAYIKGLEDYYRFRWPNLSHFLMVERQLWPTAATDYPLFPAASDVKTLRESLTRAAFLLVLYGIPGGPP